MPRFLIFKVVSTLTATLVGFGCVAESKTLENAASTTPLVRTATKEQVPSDIENAYLAVVKLENSVPDFGKNEHEAFYRDQTFWIKEGKVVQAFMDKLDAFQKEKEKAYGKKEGERQLKSLLLDYQQRFGATFHGLFRCIEGARGMEGLRAAKKYVQSHKSSLTKYAHWRLDPVE